MLKFRDPQVQKDFVDTLYTGGAATVSHGLAPNGILVAQVGEADTIHSPSSEFSVDKTRLKFIDNLVALGVNAVREYEESHSGFFSPWSFVVAFKEPGSLSEWFSNSAEIDLKMRKRTMDAMGGGSLFRHFDGATMESFRFPSKGCEVSFCRTHASSRECVVGHGWGEQRLNLCPLPKELDDVNKRSRVLGAGMWTKADIHHNSYHGNYYVSPVSIGFRIVALILCLMRANPLWKDSLTTLTDESGSLHSFQVSARNKFGKYELLYVNHSDLFVW